MDNPPDTNPTSPINLFESERVDPDKLENGVWITHPSTEDQFRVRKLNGTQHLIAFLSASEQYQEEHGEGSHLTPEGKLHVEAVGLASGLIVDWKLKKFPGAPYDKAMMASTLADPELVEVRNWFRIQTAPAETFRPDQLGKL